MQLRSDIEGMIDFQPRSANPTLKTKITFTLGEAFPYTLTRDDFTINATSIDDPTYVRYLNVIGANDADKTLDAMFGGAWSGIFKFSIRHKIYGLLDTDLFLFDVSTNVTSVSINEISPYGGTLITI